MSNPQNVVFGYVIQVLEKLNIPYMIGGSVAAIVYGEPRLTLDMDVVIDLKETQAKDFVGQFGPEYYVNFESIIEAIKNKLIALAKKPHLDNYQKLYDFLGKLVKRDINNQQVAIILKDIIFKRNSSDSVIALPPSGLKDAYSKTIKKVTGIVVAITDAPENILKRITFYDIDSKLIQKELSDEETAYHLKEIKKDITYFGKTYKRAHVMVDIAGLSIENSVSRIQDTVQSYFGDAFERKYQEWKTRD